MAENERTAQLQQVALLLKKRYAKVASSAIIDNADGRAISLLEGLDLSSVSDQIYSAIVVSSAISPRFRTLSFSGQYASLVEVNRFKRIAQFFNSKLQVPDYIGMLLSKVITSTYGSAALPHFIGEIPNRADSPDSRKKARQTLEESISLNQEFNQNNAVAETFKNLVKVYKNEFGPLPEKTIKGLESLMVNLVSNYHNALKGYELVLAVYSSPQNIDKAVFANAADTIKSQRQEKLMKPIAERFTSRFMFEYGSAIEKTQDLQHLATLHEFLQKNFDVKYKLEDELKDLAPEINPNTDRFKVEYFCLVAAAHKKLSSVPINKIVPFPAFFNSDGISGAIIRSLHNAKNNPPLHQKPEELELLEEIYSKGYHVIFGKTLENAIQAMNVHSGTISKLTPPDISSKVNAPALPVPQPRPAVQPFSPPQPVPIPEKLPEKTFTLYTRILQGMAWQRDNVPRETTRAVDDLLSIISLRYKIKASKAVDEISLPRVGTRSGISFTGVGIKLTESEFNTLYSQPQLNKSVSVIAASNSHLIHLNDSGIRFERMPGERDLYGQPGPTTIYFATSFFAPQPLSSQQINSIRVALASSAKKQ